MKLTRNQRFGIVTGNDPNLTSSDIAKASAAMSRPRRSRIPGKRLRSRLRVQSRREGVGLSEETERGTVTLAVAW